MIAVGAPRYLDIARTGSVLESAGLTNACCELPDGTPGAVGSDGLTTTELCAEAGLDAPAKTVVTTAQTERPVVGVCTHDVPVRAVVEVCWGMYWPVGAGQVAVPGVTFKVLTMYWQLEVQEPVVGAFHVHVVW